jgi:hypothetical protein
VQIVLTTVGPSGVWAEVENLVWWSASAFVFLAYLFALFAIIVDVLRDGALNSWRKALWLVVLVVIPFVAALVYLIARGRGMAERARRSAAPASPADEIAKARALLDDGAITPAEYERLKAKALH